MYEVTEIMGLKIENLKCFKIKLYADLCAVDGDCAVNSCAYWIFLFVLLIGFFVFKYG